MKKSALFLALLIFPVIIAFPAHRIYVSTAGNDLNEGTKERPLESLTGARDQKLFSTVSLLNRCTSTGNAASGHRRQTEAIFSG